MKKMNKNAFTLIELLVVIAVVGILVLLGAPRFVGTVEKARETQIKNDVKAVESVIIDQLSKENRFPWESPITHEELVDKLDEVSLYDKTGALSADIIKGDYIEIPPPYAEEMTGSKLDGVFYADYEGGILYLRDSETKYIYVSNAKDLENVKDNLEGNFIQTRDINLEDVSFEPLGNSSTPFTGTYDGGNYVITGLETKGGSYQGLFGRTEGAIIRNVGLIGNKVTGTGGHVGGLVGQAANSTIENSYVTGSVKSSGTTAGGLVGRAVSSTIENSYATVSVESTGSYNVGGLVGEATSSIIENSYFTGSVKGINEVGGLVGHANGSTTISNSYATGPVTGSGYNVGGLAGQADDITISNSYWDKETTNQSTSSGGGEGKTTDEMKQAKTYSTWGTDVWKIVNGEYPKLR